MSGDQLPDVPDDPSALTDGRPLPGPCIECQRNRARLISLGHDVVTLRRTVERLDSGFTAWRMPDSQEAVEWLMVGLCAVMVFRAFYNTTVNRGE